MNIDQIGEDLITQINDGSELAFSELYKAYYVYLNTIAIYYLFDKNVSAEVGLSCPFLPDPCRTKRLPELHPFPKEFAIRA